MTTDWLMGTLDIADCGALVTTAGGTDTLGSTACGTGALGTTACGTDTLGTT